MTGECDQRFRFPSPVLKVQFHPRREHQVLVCPMKHVPVVVNIQDGSHTVLPLDEEVQDLNITEIWFYNFPNDSWKKIELFTIRFRILDNILYEI